MCSCFGGNRRNTEGINSGICLTASDHFFQDKTELIYYTLSGVIVALGIFCILILWMFREQQEGKMESQMGIFLASGYQGKIIKRLFSMDGCLDLLLSVSMAYGIFCAAMSKLCENETLRSIYSITGKLTWIGISAVLFSGILFMVVFDHVSKDFESGKFYEVMGRSGAGKSTLLNIIGTIN